MRAAVRSGALLAASLLAACATHAPAPAPAPPVADYATRESVLETALGQIGRPYRYGGGDGEGFDCSGLVQFVYAQVGVQLPRTAAQQREHGYRIALSDAVPGDLVFFRTESGMHATIYVGEGRFVHAPSAGREVTVSTIGERGYWHDRLSDVVRVLR